MKGLEEQAVLHARQVAHQSVRAFTGYEEDGQHGQIGDDQAQRPFEIAGYLERRLAVVGLHDTKIPLPKLVSGLPCRRGLS
jgi:hypothetical protein